MFSFEDNKLVYKDYKSEARIFSVDWLINKNINLALMDQFISIYKLRTVKEEDIISNTLGWSFHSYSLEATEETNKNRCVSAFNGLLTLAAIDW